MTCLFLILFSNVNVHSANRFIKNHSSIEANNPVNTKNDLRKSIHLPSIHRKNKNLSCTGQTYQYGSLEFSCENLSDSTI